MEFKRILENEKERIEDLSCYASAIVKEHFDPIIGSAQNDYMISLFQTPEAIASQIEEGYMYYEIYDQKRIGFISLKKRENELYISKFYLHKDARGKGYARGMFDFIKQQAIQMNLNILSLNVNKENPAILTYEKLGFIKVEEVCNDIGQGFYMDDYVYHYTIKE